MSIFRVIRAIWLLPAIGLAFVWTSALADVSGPPEPPPEAAVVRAWVRDLGADQFAERRAATRRLTGLGRPAIDPVAAAADGSDLEVTNRGVEILSTISYSRDAETAQAAKQALMRLAGSHHRHVAAKALATLHDRQTYFAAKLGELSARVHFNGERYVAIFFDGTSAQDDQLAPLAELVDLEFVSFADTQIGDGALRYVKDLPNVKQLILTRSQVTDAGLKELAGMHCLLRLPLSETRVTDAGLAHLAGLTQLEFLSLRDDNITDAGLVHLERLTNLTGLNLAGTKVTDAGLAHLKPLTKLTTLRLHTTAVTDAGLKQLASLKNLTRLVIYETHATPAGMARLQQALPQLLFFTKPQEDEEEE